MFISDSVINTNKMDNYTVSGHVVGMLDRDQRTAKLRCNSCNSPSAMFLEFHNPSHYYYIIHSRAKSTTHPQRDSNKTIIIHRHTLKRRSSTRSRKNSSYLWNSLRRLKQALIAAIYLLSLVSVPCSLSAPTRLRHMAARNEPGKWVDPCNLKNAGNEYDMNAEVPKENDSVVIERIVTQANIAYGQADAFKEDFADKLFNIEFQRLHENWKNTEYEWLPQKQDLHKGLNEPVPQEHLNMLTVNDSLLNTYHYLQVIAVGLEQIVWDQQDDDGPLLQSFNQSEHHLRSVLCEIETAIHERNIQNRMMEDVKRDIMPDYLRDESNRTVRNVRDWIIYREYMNVLEYVRQVFQHLLKNL